MMTRCAILAAVVAVSAAVCWSVPAMAAGPVLTKVRVYAKEGKNEVLKNARITGSITSATNDFVELGRMREVAADGEWIELEVDAKGAIYRFLKIETPPNSYGSVAEVEFFAGGKQLSGEKFGTNGSRDNKGNTFDKALDGDVATYFEGVSHGDEYVGIDLGAAVQVGKVAVSKAGGAYGEAVTVELATDTPGAVIRYRLDGYAPGEDGQVYQGPVKVEKSSVLHAIAYKDGLARAVGTVVPYRIGPAEARAAKSFATFHIGNSLTDTVDGWLAPVMESAGYSHKFYRFTIPGAPTDWLWNHPGGGFGEVQFKESFLVRAPLTDVFTQPFEGHNRSIENEAEFSANFFGAAQEHSPEIQPWLYSQWPERSAKGSWCDGTGANKGLEGVTPAGGDYTVAAENHLRYFEAVADKINSTRKGKLVRIVPTARAMAKAKVAIESGKVPGLSDFGAFYSDDLHLSPQGRWFVANVVAASLTGASTEGKVAVLNSGLTEAQGKALQAVAWEVVKGYPRSGAK